jgi:hypothetical protein
MQNSIDLLRIPSPEEKRKEPVSLVCFYGPLLEYCTKNIIYVLMTSMVATEILRLSKNTVPASHQTCKRAEPQLHHICLEYQVGSTQVFDTLTRQDIRSNRRDNAYRLIFFICERSKPHGSQELRWSSCGDHRRG